MLQERYEYKRTLGFHQYEFYSDGPKGRIRKVILYSFAGIFGGFRHYNLGFGDHDPVLNRINDLTVSNNLDREKVLATVAATAMDFTERFADCRILLKGSTQSRTRLYQMKIAEHYQAIAESFDIKGLTSDGSWISFRSRENYMAFVIKRK